MDDNTIESRLSAYIHDECLPRDGTVELEYDKNLFEAGIVDSAGLISFICYIEKEFHLNIPDEDLLPQNFVSITAIAQYIRTRRRVYYDHC
jgi:acyl carrier protein